MEDHLYPSLIFSSTTDEWNTPQPLFDHLDAEFHFTLDVAADAFNTKCANYYTREDDGLTQPWTGVCWMNPPYGRVLPKWLAKAKQSGEEGAVVVCLIPARPDTQWWWNHVIGAEIRFMKGRVKFGGHVNPSPFPSAVVVYGTQECVKWMDLPPDVRGF